MSGPSAERGLTLTELTVVILLAAVVMTGLVVFYLNSQALWMDGSAQAITQRELTLALHSISDHARVSGSAEVSGDPFYDLELRLDAYTPVPGTEDPDSAYCFWLADSVIHEGYRYASDPARHDLGPVMQSRILAFAAHKDANMVYVDSIRALTPQGKLVTMGSEVALMNRRTP
jgi:hypothetical protein